MDFIEFLAFILFQTLFCRTEIFFFFIWCLKFFLCPFWEEMAGKGLCGRRDCQSCFIAERLFEKVGVVPFRVPQGTSPAAGGISADPCLTCCAQEARRVSMT